MKIRALLPVAILLLVTSPLFAGPPWITVELPPNPFDQASRGAFVLVHAFHHSSDGGGDPVVGRAVGLVDGQRRSVTLSFERTSRPGVFALKNSWGDKGEWTLVITNQQESHGGGAAEIMVRVSGNRVIGVEAATKPSKSAELPLEPRRFTDAEIEASLRNRSAGD